MLKNKEELKDTNSAYKFIGYDDQGNREYLVNIKENTHSKKDELNYDDFVFDDLDYDWDFDDTTVNNEVERKPDYIDDDRILTRNDFFRMEWKETQYQIYRLLVNISSSLSNVQEVAKQNNK